MFRIGEMVKIEDIGVPATCIGVKDKEVQLELNGERFWIINSLCHSMAEMEDAA